MSFANCEELRSYYISQGVSKILFKLLAENDNSKQQIYLGGSFSVLHDIPFGQITEFPDNSVPNYKAAIELWWVNENRESARAQGAQLILYPKYPEVRLSGFLKGCHTAPSSAMHPISSDERKNNNTKDGRILFLGITSDKRILAYLAVKDSFLSQEIFTSLTNTDNLPVLNEFLLESSTTAGKAVLRKTLAEIMSKDWIPSCRMYSDGEIRPYIARNAGGYTLEALFGIIPNGSAEPDFMGWELKTYTSGNLTLMTPEPDKGLYREIGAKEFALRYGHDSEGYLKYFTGPFKCGVFNELTGLTMILQGYNTDKNTITDIAGGIHLVDKKGFSIAIWSFAALLKHWCSKHAHACYVRYKKREVREGEILYKYISPACLGEGTSFELFLRAFNAGLIVYDPGISVKASEKGGSRVKARSQFRIAVKNLPALYYNFESLEQ